MKTLILGRGDIAALMRPRDYLEAVEAAFLALADDRIAAPHPLHLPGREGGFHAKAATYRTARRLYAAIKWNGNFPHNPERFGLPTIQGALFLSDAENGALLAVMDFGQLTKRRTAAASALAAQRLARRDAGALLVVGAGEQGRAHLDALREAMPITRALVFDQDRARAASLASEAGAEATDDLAGAARASDIIVTCTTARTAFLERAHVREGAFVAAVGADHPHKSEIAPDLIAAAALVVDDRAQCAAMGDLHHAVAAGAVDASHVRAELSEVAAGREGGRRNEDEIVVFDSTGLAAQDVVCAAMIHERARERGCAVTWEAAA